MESFLSQSQEEAYKKLHKKSKEKRQADRIKAILLLNKGWSYEAIAEALMIDDYTLRRWYGYYVEGGIDYLLKDEYKGGEPKLNIEQVKELTTHLQSRIYLSAKEICHYVKKHYEVEFTIKGMTSMLHRLEFTYKKPKQLPGKSDKKAQQEFIKEYEQIKVSKNPEDKIIFIDAVHPLHNSQPAFGWIKKGEEQALPANTGRMRVNINGAYDIQYHDVTIQEDESINAQSTIALFEKLLKKYPSVILYLIVDNARYYRSKKVQEFVAQHSRLKLKFLPPYSPNLNLIERLWKFFKKKVTYNKYYEKYDVFRDKCTDFFENIGQYKSELQTLMTENFYVFDVKFSQT